jgi:hypothetical protein
MKVQIFQLKKKPECNASQASLSLKGIEFIQAFQTVF